MVARVGWDNHKQWGATSADGGKTWTPFKSMPKGKGAGSIAVAADGSALVWAPLEGPVVFSHDGGATWARAEGSLKPRRRPTGRRCRSGRRPTA